MGNRLTQKERIKIILDDGDWHSRGEFIYTHYLPKHDSRISEMITAGVKIEKEMQRSTSGRYEMHYRIAKEPVQQVLIPLSRVYSD